MYYQIHVDKTDINIKYFIYFFKFSKRFKIKIRKFDNMILIVYLAVLN